MKIQTVLLAFLISASLFCLAADSPGKLPDEMARLSNTYQDETKNWVIRAFAALGLKEIPDSRSAEIIARIVLAKNPHPYLLTYALAGLSELPPVILQGGLEPKVIDALIRRWLRADNPLNNNYILATLAKISGTKERDAAAWKRWWDKEQKAYAKKAPVLVAQPPADPPERPSGRAGAEPAEKVPQGTISVFQRLKKLEETGLDLTLVYDATGSMSSYITETQKEINRLYAVLKELIPSFRFGIVAYWDMAQMILPLTDNQEEIAKKMKSLGASGGADWAEGVDKGLEMALFSDKTSWRETANKVIIIIGDASPHSEDLEKIYQLAEDAHNLKLKKPEGKNQPGGQTVKTPAPKKVTTADGAKPGPPQPEPYVIHTVVVGDVAAALTAVEASINQLNKDVMAVFGKIAEKGGGIRIKLADKEKLVQEIMTLTFGKQWETEISQFIRIYSQILAQTEEKKK